MGVGGSQISQSGRQPTRSSQEQLRYKERSDLSVIYVSSPRGLNKAKKTRGYSAEALYIHNVIRLEMRVHSF